MKQSLFSPLPYYWGQYVSDNGPLASYAVDSYWVFKNTVKDQNWS